MVFNFGESRNRKKKLSTVNKKQKTSDCVCAHKIKKKKMQKKTSKSKTF